MLSSMVRSRRLRYVGHIHRYPRERWVRKGLSTIWPGEFLRGRRTTWIKQVQKELAKFDLELDIDKEEYREKLDDIFRLLP